MKIFLANWNNALTDLALELEQRGHEMMFGVTLKEAIEKSDILVIWNETDIVGGENSGRNIVKRMQKLGKPAVLIQHGRRGTSRIYPPFNEELISDAVCVWGEADKQRLIDCGCDPDRIKVTGTPIFKHLKPRIKNDIPTVLFSPDHWDGGEIDENLVIAGELRKLEGVKIITKILSVEHEPDWYDNPIVSDRNSEGHLEACANVLAQADLVVSLSESTFELMAQHLDIPVIIPDIWIPKAAAGDDRYLQMKKIFSNACSVVKYDKLNKTIKHQLKHPEELREQRKQIIIDDGGADIKDPVDEMIKVIESLV